MSLLADIFVTIGGKQSSKRIETVTRSLASLEASFDRNTARVTLCLDGSSNWILDEKSRLPNWVDFVLSSAENVGLAPTINRAIAHIKSINDWHDGPGGDKQKVAPFVVMCQDDIEYEPDWLPTLARMHLAYSSSIGFSTGHEAVEHAGTKRGPKLQDGMFYQDWIRATHMMAYRHYWESLMPIPALDPETRQLRGKPNDGRGSGVDWWMIRNHEKSVVKSRKTNLVIPGLVRHIGYDQSTWLDRSLPESESDLEAITKGRDETNRHDIVHKP